MKLQPDAERCPVIKYLVTKKANNNMNLTKAIFINLFIFVPILYFFSVTNYYKPQINFDSNKQRIERIVSDAIEKKGFEYLDIHLIPSNKKTLIYSIDYLNNTNIEHAVYIEKQKSYEIKYK